VVRSEAEIGATLNVQQSNGMVIGPKNAIKLNHVEFATHGNVMFSELAKHQIVKFHHEQTGQSKRLKLTTLKTASTLHYTDSIDTSKQQFALQNASLYATIGISIRAAYDLIGK
jgi:hypothetical protein